MPGQVQPERSFEEIQKDLTWSFQFYRNVGQYATKDPLFKKLKVPVTPAPSRVGGRLVALTQRFESPNLRPLVSVTKKDSKSTTGSDSRIRRGAKRGRTELVERVEPYGLVYDRVLGWGGHGVVCLFHLDTAEGGRDYFVAKCNFSNKENADSSLTLEKQRQKVAYLGFFAVRLEHCRFNF